MFLVHALHVVLCHPQASDDAHHTFHVSSLSPSLSLSLSLFFGLFPSPSPLTYASYQNSSYTALRSNQVAPTQRGDLDSIISSPTCHRGGADALSALYAGLFYSIDNNMTPQRSAFTFKGILLS